MAYSVNWLTKVVTIPKADMTLVSASPEVYELDVVQFWTTIHDIQDDEGMPYVDIMRSNAPFVLSGQTYARAVEVINGYSIEFEDGAYQVNLIGANNNISDVRVPNNVSVSSFNSAGAVIVSTGSGLSAAQDATLTTIQDILEGDQEHQQDGVSPEVIIRQKDTKAILVRKIRTGGSIPADINIEEPP